MGGGAGMRAAVATFVAAAACLASACSPGPQEGAAAAYAAHDVTLTPAQRQHIRLYTVQPLAFRKAIETTGVVDFDNDQATSVLAPFSGPVTRLLVSAGDKVRKGQSLAIVDSPDFAAAVAAYDKAAATARTDRQLAEADKDLLGHQGVSEREALQAQTDAANAEADREAARQALAALGGRPQGGVGGAGGAQEGTRTSGRTQGVIRAPIAGTVAERLITPGQFLQGGTTPSFTVADLSRVWVMAQIAEADLASVKVGDPAQVAAGAASVAGTVANLSDVVNPDTRAVLARVVVANPGGLLRKQMYVRVRIQSRGESRGLLAPVSAVLRDDENLPFVYIAQADGAFARRHVTLGERTGETFDIAEGLQPGDRIVADGGIFLQFMQSQ